MAEYSEVFYDYVSETSEPSARQLWPIVLTLSPIRSAVDVGCGNGSWLRVLGSLGVEDILGLDGSWIDAKQVKIPAHQFQRCAIDQPFTLARRFDLAISLEVAEHLPAARAPGFVADLTCLAPLVLFSAAIPGQGGHHHINEQWPTYWQDLFAQHGFRPVDCLRMRIWNDPSISWWYRQNILFFAHDDALNLYPRFAAFAQDPAYRVAHLVHPHVYARVFKQAHPRLRQWIGMGREAVARTWTGRAPRVQP